MSKKTIIFWFVGIVVLVLLFIGIVIPRVVGGNSACGIDHACVNMTGTATALKMFKMSNGAYPTTEEGLNALIKNPNPKKYPNYSSTNYLKKFPYDVWENPILYIHLKTDKRESFQLISFGADGKYGGDGENEDIIYPDCG